MNIENIYSRLLLEKTKISSEVKSRFISDLQHIINEDIEQLSFIEMLEQVIPHGIDVDICNLISKYPAYKYPAYEDFDTKQSETIKLIITCLMLDCDHISDLGDEKFENFFNCYIVSLNKDLLQFFIKNEDDFLEWGRLFGAQEQRKTEYAKYEKESLDDPFHRFLTQDIDEVFSKRTNNGLFDDEMIIVKSDFIDNLTNNNK